MRRITVALLPLAALLATGCAPQERGSAPGPPASAAPRTPPAPGLAPSPSAIVPSPKVAAAKVPPEVERYGKEYTALMTGFRDDMLSITRRHPLPPEPVGKADKQRAQEYRRQVQTVSRAATAEIAARTSGWVKRLEALRPPPQMREFHAANVAALQAQEEGNRLISRSLAPGLKREEQERLRGEAEKARARQLAATERMVRALESAGGAAPPSMRALIEELQAAGE